MRERKYQLLFKTKNQKPIPLALNAFKILYRIKTELDFVPSFHDNKMLMPRENKDEILTA